MVRRETNVTECWTYGERGQKQHGLDILGELSSTVGFFVCYQCKRVAKFSSAEIRKAVDKFLQGKWAGRTKRLVLCTSLPLVGTKQTEEITRQHCRLQSREIEFEIWDASEGGRLSERLKNYPDLVDDFFLREWVRRFNGEEAASSLGERLDGARLSELRAHLLAIYSTLFGRSDQGIRIGSGRAIPLIDRYVPPAVVETREFGASGETSIDSAAAPNGQGHLEKEPERTKGRPVGTTSIHELRIPVGDWLSRNNRSVILGEPGYGKSSLLRVMALQLLNGLDDPFLLPCDP
jgi:hypothetical protein